MPAGANETIQLALIGVGGRGYGEHLDWFGRHTDVNIAAICDVHEPYVTRAITKLGGKAKGYHDYRKLLDDDQIDAVVVCTPPQWHALISIEAMQAGKDVYCEKPMSRFPNEAKRMADAAKKYKCITQVGTQIHATPNYHRCVDVVRSGTLGEVTCISNFCTMNDNSEGLAAPPDSEPLPGLDWDTWLGPAPSAPFNIARFRDGMHRYFADYVDSWLHELGPHIVDLPFWAMDLPCPIRISATGGRYATTSMADVPDTMHVTWEFDNPPLIMTWTLLQQNAFPFGVGEAGSGRKLGIVFHGKDRTLLANYGLCQVLDKKGTVIEGETFPQTTAPSPGHEREFLDSVKSRQECSCSFQAHLPLHTALNLAHIALETGRTLHFDADKWECTGDKDATKRMQPKYRDPWKLPKI